MKQNEKILVYAVTGFLVVILLIAIVFGKDGPRVEEPQGGSSPLVRSLEDVLKDRAGDRAEEVVASGDSNSNPISDGELGDGLDEGGAPLAGSATLADASAEDTDSSTSPVALVAMAPPLPPTAASVVTEKLGLSRREHDYRIVRARSGDSLGVLVQTWCGSNEPYFDEARSLNEELTVLQVGQEVVLPWVDDEVILAAYERRRNAAPTVGVDATAANAVWPTPAASPAASPASSAPASSAPASSAPISSAPVAAPGRKYKVQPGDSLWKIAERLVGRRSVPSYLEKVRNLNPGLDVDRLKVGQVLLLPSGS